jgi:telomerase reverse transcriptase
MLQSYVVHRGNQQFLMTRGQPQGACLSSVLCDIYYSDIDKTQLREFQNDSDLLIRAVDDYLYVTTSLDRAVWYVTD